MGSQGSLVNAEVVQFGELQPAMADVYFYAMGKLVLEQARA